MAEVPASEPMPSSSEGAVGPDAKDPDEPLTKKRKITDKEGIDKLEHRLGGILCCSVCLDLPLAAVYQCSNGHLMCAACFTHLLADARLRDETATCPNCRMEISKTSASRNLAVEKTVSELPSECKFCTGVFPRHSLQHHEQNTCDDRKFKFSQIVVDGSPDRRYLDSLVRIVSSVYYVLAGGVGLAPPAGRAPLRRRQPRRITGCRFACIGCGWRGPAHESGAHEVQCAHPHKSAGEVVGVLAERDKRDREATVIYNQVLELLSYEKITFNDLQLKPYRTEEFLNQLYYETSRFSAFGHQWVMKAYVNKNQRDPTQSYQRDLTYQLILKSKTVCGLALQWVLLRGPYGEVRLSTRVCTHTFHEDAPDSAHMPLPLTDLDDTNHLVSNKSIHFRLIMFLSSK